MNERDFAALLNDVAACYRTPRDLWDGDGLTAAQKIQALRQWEHDLRLLQTAGEENMLPAGADGTALMLQEVHCLLEAAGAVTAESAPTKVGGSSGTASRKPDVERASGA